MIRYLWHVPAVTALVLLIVACARSGEDDAQEYAPEIDPANFVGQVDNRYFPLVPGTTFRYEQAGGGEQVEVYVTRDTKVVMGVSCVVVRSREYEDGELVEETLDWYAQDAAGNVWYFGEDTREYEEGTLSSTAGSWEGGVHGAFPGVIMEAEPWVGDSYRQEYYPGHAEDMAEVLRLADTVAVPHGTFTDVLVTKEWTPLEPGDEEEAYYAPGVGLVLEVEGNDRIELARVITEAAGVEDARAGTMYPARAESGREAGWRRATQRLARGL
jgi:hypothetical protein